VQLEIGQFNRAIDVFVGNCWLDAGRWKLDVGCWMLDVGSWKLEVGSWS